MTSIQSQPTPPAQTTSKSAGPPPPAPRTRNPAALAQEYQTRRQELQGLAQKMGELEADADEHLLVIKTLKETDEDRRCFRLVGGVLLEKRVKEVVPTLESSVQGLKQVMDTLMKQYKQREEELIAFQKEHGASS